MHIFSVNGVDMQAIWAEQALLEGDFARDVRVVRGRRVAVSSLQPLTSTAEPDDTSAWALCCRRR